LWLDTLRNDKDIVADIDFKWTSHIDTFLNWAEETGRKVRIVALKRDVDEVVDSYDKWKPNSDHWSFHGYRDTKPDQWDKCYPTFDTESKREGIRRFWYRVYNIIDQYRSDKRVRLFRTEDLNTEKGVGDILDFVGYDDPKIEVGIQFKAPQLQSVDNDNIGWQ
jgi:integrase